MRLILPERFLYPDGPLTPNGGWTTSHDGIPTPIPLGVVSHGIQNTAGSTSNHVCDSQHTTFNPIGWNYDFDLKLYCVTRRDGLNRACSLYGTLNSDTSAYPNFSFTPNADGATMDVEMNAQDGGLGTATIAWTEGTEQTLTLRHSGNYYILLKDDVQALSIDNGVPWHVPDAFKRRLELQTDNALVAVTTALFRITRIDLYIPDDIPTSGLMAFNGDGASQSVSSGTASAGAIAGVLARNDSGASATMGSGMASAGALTGILVPA